MANLTADEINRLKQAFVSNDRDGTLTERVKNVVNGDTFARTVSFTVSAEGVPSADKVTVNVQLKDSDGDNITAVTKVRTYLATTAAGTTIRNPPATNNAAGATGTLLFTDGTFNFNTWLTNASGSLDIVVTDASGAQTYFLIVELPVGTISASTVLTFA